MLCKDVLPTTTQGFVDQDVVIHAAQMKVCARTYWHLFGKNTHISVTTPAVQLTPVKEQGVVAPLEAQSE
jgi:hypothetical protein